MHLGGLRRGLIVVLVSATGACGAGPVGDGHDDDAPKAATGRYGKVHTEVCAAARFSDAGDRTKAEETFDDVHFGLHALVQAVEQQDRATAARLLEAIEAQESQPSTVALEALTERVAESIERTGATAPDVCP